MSWYAERQEQKREDKRADVELELRQKEFEAEQRRKDRKDEVAERRREREAAEKRKADRQDKRRQRRQEVVAKLTKHKVELFIYSIAVVSFVMAAPAMADYGNAVYGGLSALPFTGWLLPVITELGMWACAFAVHQARRENPDAVVFWKQAGVWGFASGAVVLNVLHGIGAGFDAAVVMGFVSVAGVLLHQIAVASPPRSRAQRAAARIARQVARKEFDARQAAIRDARVEIDAEGTARLVFEPGVYRVGRDRKARLAKVSNVLDKPGVRDRMDDEIAALIDAEIAREVADEAAPEHDDDSDDTASSGGVATLDRPGPESTPTQQKSSGNGGRRGVRLGGRQSRSMDELRAELERLVQAGEVDPRYTESIRKGLRCAKPTAKQLRDEYRR